MAPPDVQTAVVVTRLRVMRVDEYVDEWADLEVQQRPVPKPQKGQVGKSVVYHRIEGIVGDKKPLA